MAVLMNRRLALMYGLSGAAALWGLPSATRAQVQLGWTPRALSVDEARVLSAACERIMPASDTPGAVAAGVPQNIDRTLATWSSAAEVSRLKGGLTILDSEARSKFGGAFASVTAAQQDAVLTLAEAEARASQAQRPPQAHYFSQLREMTTTGYFTSQIGATQALRYDPNPGEYRGCVPLREIGRAWAT